MRHGIILASTIGLALAGTVHAGLLTYEGFDYPSSSSLNEQSGGTGWDANWGAFLGGTGDHTVASSTLHDPSNTLQTSANRTTTGGAFAGRYPLLPGYGAAGSSVYYSILIRPESTPDTDDYYGLQLFSNNGGTDLFIGKGGSAMTYRLEGNSTSSDSALSATLGQTVLLVARIDFNPSGNVSDPETFRLYVNPLPGASEPATADATLSFNLGSQNGLALNSGNGSSVSFDEIRIGTDYASVVPAIIPEPASLSLLALAAGVMARRRHA
jgi:hypothetical protein